MVVATGNVTCWELKWNIPKFKPADGLNYTKPFEIRKEKFQAEVRPENSKGYYIGIRILNPSSKFILDAPLMVSINGQRILQESRMVPSEYARSFQVFIQSSQLEEEGMLAIQLNIPSMSTRRVSSSNSLES